MQILYDEDPKPDRRFVFQVREATGEVSIAAFINNQEVGRHRCPDPPCHESIHIPLGGAGQTLRVVAEDAIGTFEEQIAIGYLEMEMNQGS